MDIAALKLALATELTVLEKLGEGGEGEVFLVRREASEEAASRGEPARLLALKLLREGHRGVLPQALELRHPGIVETLGAGRVQGRSYILMEYVDGRPLRERLARGPLTERELRGVFTALAEGLEHAHRHGIVHQDVKPENVLLRDGPGGLVVKLADFGLAGELGEDERRALLASRSVRSTDEKELRSLAGTLPYLAPERLADPPPAPDARVDVFSLGVLLFEALTGRPPGGLELPSELRPELDRRWDAVVKRALARDPERRFPDVASLRHEVLAILARGTLRPSERALRVTAAGGAGAGEAAPRGPAPGRGAGMEGLTRGRAGPSERHPARGESRPGTPDADRVSIPGGVYVMGNRAAPEASPEREVELRPFLADRLPVTHAAYLAFVLATGARPPRSWIKRGAPPRRLPSALQLLPVTGVTWAEATAYAAWAKRRLPTEAEWERLARGRAGRPFPYGPAFDRSRIHAEQGALASVLAHPEGASDEGVLDLTGNAWEWCADWFGPYDPRERRSPRGPSSGEARVIRGGYDPAQPGSASAWFRAFLRPDVAHPRVGFRCVAGEP